MFVRRRAASQRGATLELRLDDIECSEGDGEDEGGAASMDEFVNTPYVDLVAIVDVEARVQATHH